MVLNLTQVIGRRILQLIPVLVGVTLINFLLLNLLPGGTAVAILGASATSQEVTVLTKELGLNRPVMVRYWDWLWAAVHGNLGHSLLTQQSVASLLGQRVPVTAELLLLAFLIAFVLSIPLAVLSAWRPRGVVDRISNLLAMVGLSTPNFIVALVLVLVLAIHLRVLPSTGFQPLSAGLWPNVQTLIMPAVAMSLVLFATYLQVLRGDMVDQLAKEDYVVAVRARGVSTWRLLVQHVLRNSLFGIITVVGVNIGTLIGGTVIVESMFSIPGVGQLLVSSIFSRDAPVVEGVVVMMAIVVVMVNLVTDLLYAVLDPRVRYGATG